ncbi:MAG: imidazoleglycerol-phosphate dehydratase HisB [Sulfurihydrogenibium sp.]|uniref:imidazoleglycerol-phosphate dehydratase HisB n=1 Tax=Sulfurihydrogenibium sp. TaxID=2053621 RepID=UPI000CC3628D|nr:MAG: imidazoleglycerol-phosphate dehydratase HisB [Sulfurihydrogenibium sp.]
MERKAFIKRETKETQIEMSLNLDGTGKHKIDTQVGFLSHMLESFSFHSMIDLEVMATGDVHVSHHHLVEDVGIVLGLAVKEALGDKKGIKRFGYSIIPMDEALALCSIDLSGRPLLFYDDLGYRGKITHFDYELMGEFFKGFALSAGVTMHLKALAGHNLHHIAESLTKAFAIALKEAISIDPRRNQVPSTKGMI